MTAVLLDYQHQVGEGPVFGTGTDYPVGDWLLSPAAITDGDLPQTTRDGVIFGDDLASGMHVEWGIGVRKPGDPAAARQAVQALAAIWAFEGRRTPGATLAYRYKMPGQGTRVIYGRPRKFDPTWAQLVNGWVPISATFDAQDSVAYDDTETSVTMSLSWQADEPLGFAEPMTDPLSEAATDYSPDYAGQMINVGDRTTWPVVRFTGPVLSPRCTFNGGPYIDLALDLAAGEFVEVDTAPTRHTVLKGSGSGVPDQNVYSAFAARGSTFPGLPPGMSSLRYSAQAHDAPTTCRVTARAVYTL